MSLEVRLRPGEEQCSRHQPERSAACRDALDVLSRESVTKDLHATASDDAPEEPHAEQPGEREAEYGNDVDAEDLWAALREDPDQAGPDQAAGDDHRHDEAVEDDVEPVEQVVQALVHEADLDLAVAHLLERVVQLVRKLERHLPEAERLL